MTSYNQLFAICPFFVNDDGMSKIVCNGIVDKSRISLEYRRKADYKNQMKTFCCDRYINCEIYRILIEKEEHAEDE